MRVTLPDVDAKADRNLDNVPADLGDAQKTAIRTKIGALADTVTIPTRYDQLSGEVPEGQIPDSIARDAEVDAAVAALNTQLQAQLANEFPDNTDHSNKVDLDFGNVGDGAVPDRVLPSSVVRSSAYNRNGILFLLGLSSAQFNDLFLGIQITAGRLVLTRIDGSTVSLTLPSDGGGGGGTGIADGVVTDGRLANNNRTLVLERSEGLGSVDIDVSALLQVNLTAADIVRMLQALTGDDRLSYNALKDKPDMLDPAVLGNLLASGGADIDEPADFQLDFPDTSESGASSFANPVTRTLALPADIPDGARAFVRFEVECTGPNAFSGVPPEVNVSVFQGNTQLVDKHIIGSSPGDSSALEVNLANHDDDVRLEFAGVYHVVHLGADFRSFTFTAASGGFEGLLFQAASALVDHRVSTALSPVKHDVDTALQVGADNAGSISAIRNKTDLLQTRTVRVPPETVLIADFSQNVEKEFTAPSTGSFQIGVPSAIPYGHLEFRVNDIVRAVPERARDASRTFGGKQWFFYLIPLQANDVVTVLQVNTTITLAVLDDVAMLVTRADGHDTRLDSINAKLASPPFALLGQSGVNDREDREIDATDANTMLGAQRGLAADDQLIDRLPAFADWDAHDYTRLVLSLPAQAGGDVFDFAVQAARDGNPDTIPYIRREARSDSDSTPVLKALVHRAASDAVTATRPRYPTRSNGAGAGGSPIRVKLGVNRNGLNLPVSSTLSYERALPPRTQALTTRVTTFINGRNEGTTTLTLPANHPFGVFVAATLAPNFNTGVVAQVRWVSASEIEFETVNTGTNGAVNGGYVNVVSQWTETYISKAAQEAGDVYVEAGIPPASGNLVFGLDASGDTVRLVFKEMVHDTQEPVPDPYRAAVQELYTIGNENIVKYGMAPTASGDLDASLVATLQGHETAGDPFLGMFEEVITHLDTLTLPAQLRVNDATGNVFTVLPGGGSNTQTTYAQLGEIPENLIPASIARDSEIPDVTALASRVTDNEDDIQDNSTAINARATTTTVNALAARVSANETSIAGNTTAIGLKADTSAVATALSGKADTSVVTALDGRVTANATAIGLKADTSAVQDSIVSVSKSQPQANTERLTFTDRAGNVENFDIVLQTGGGSTDISGKLDTDLGNVATVSEADATAFRAAIRVAETTGVVKNPYSYNVKFAEDNARQTARAMHADMGTSHNLRVAGSSTAVNRVISVFPASTTVPQNLLADIPFITKWEGSCRIQSVGNGTLYLRVTHTFRHNAGQPNQFEISRVAIERIFGTHDSTLPLSAFDSVVTLPAAAFAGIDTAVDQPVELDLRFELFTDPALSAARTEGALSRAFTIEFDHAGVQFLQHDTITEGGGGGGGLPANNTFESRTSVSANGAWVSPLDSNGNPYILQDNKWLMLGFNADGAWRMVWSNNIRSVASGNPTNSSQYSTIAYSGHEQDGDGVAGTLFISKRLSDGRLLLMLDTGAPAITRFYIREVGTGTSGGGGGGGRDAGRCRAGHIDRQPERCTGWHGADGVGRSCHRRHPGCHRKDGHEFQQCHRPVDRGSH